MKRIVVILAFAVGTIVSISSCSPYYYDNYYSRRPVVVQPRVYVRPAVPYYSRPYYHHHRSYRRGYYRY